MAGQWMRFGLAWLAVVCALSASEARAEIGREYLTEVQVLVRSVRVSLWDEQTGRYSIALTVGVEQSTTDATPDGVTRGAPFQVQVVAGVAALLVPMPLELRAEGCSARPSIEIAQLGMPGYVTTLVACPAEANASRRSISLVLGGQVRAEHAFDVPPRPKLTLSAEPVVTAFASRTVRVRLTRTDSEGEPVPVNEPTTLAFEASGVRIRPPTATLGARAHQLETQVELSGLTPAQVSVRIGNARSNTITSEYAVPWLAFLVAVLAGVAGTALARARERARSFAPRLVRSISLLSTGSMVGLVTAALIPAAWSTTQSTYYQSLAVTVLVLAFIVESAVRRLVRGMFGAPEDRDASMPAPIEIAPGSDDVPISDSSLDRLDHAPAVASLSGFLRNEGTRPRMTLAITAPWGEGKSSMMRMLAADLEKNGFRTAWFNPWHHQQEQRQLSALLNVVRVQALPSFMTEPFAFARVRAALFWARGPAYHLAVALAVLLGVYAWQELKESATEAEVSPGELLAWSFRHHSLKEPRVGVSAASLGKLRPNDKQRPLRDETFEYLKDLMGGESCLRSNTNCVFRSRGELTHALEDGLGKALLPSELAALKGAVEIFAPPPLLPKLGPFFSVLLALAGLLLTKGFSAYGFEIFGPLRSLMSGDARGSAGNEPTGTVERYRTEFSYLSKALGGRLVIFIDDLDRCDEATVNSVLELTNYLIDHSECFIVIGAAMDHVRRCIRPRSTAEAPLTGGPLETYQYDYLEKLIHLQFPVPRAKREQVDRLAGPPSTEDPAWSAQVAQAFKSYGVVAAVCGMLLVGGVGFWDAIHPVERTVLLPTAASFADARARAAEARARQLAAQAQQPQQQAIQTAVSSGAAQSLQPSPPSKAVLPQAARANAAATARGDLFDRMAWTVGLLVAAFLAFTYLVDPKLRQQVKLSLGGAVITKDSLRFQQAISLWAPLATDTNPRRFKRFVNHARLLVHYDRRMRGEETGANRPAARDAHIVALTALYKRDPLSRHNLERFANDPAIAPVLREHCQTTTEYAELGAILSDRYLVQLLRQLATRRASHGPTAIPRPEGSVRPQRLRRVRSRAPMQAAP